MFGSRQQLLKLEWTKLNELLDNGARVVWMQRSVGGGNEDTFDVVLDLDTDPEITPGQLVDGFLATVSPGVLEKKMLEDNLINLPPGEAALAALRSMVG